MRRGIGLLATLLAVLGAGSPAASAVGEPFPLPDGRAWELVSPLDKNGGEIQGFGGNLGGGVLQAAAGGGAVTYSSSASFGEGAGAPAPSQYLSLRSAAGWSTANITLPTAAGAYGLDPEGVPFQLFSGDLARAIVLIGHACSTEPCPRSYSVWQGTSTAAQPLPYEETDLRFVGSSSDLTHVVLSTCAALTADATEAPGGDGCDPAEPNLYAVSGSQLDLVNVLPGDATGTPGAALAASARAVSADGSRVYWSDGDGLYLRSGGETVPVEGGSGGPAVFQTASLDGSVVYFSEGSHLYRYLAATEAATDLTPSGGLEGVMGASDDGSRVYFTANSVIMLWQAGTTATVGSSPDPGSFPPATGTARVSPDGLHLAFVSSAKLTGYNNANPKTNAPEPEVFLYAAASQGGPAKLVCASCRPSGSRPVGPAALPGASRNGAGPDAFAAYKPRALSANGQRLFFDTYDALVTGDTNADADVYQWEASGVGSCAKAGGCVDLISSGVGEDGASFVDASDEGSDVYFLTTESLIGGDQGAADVYDARVGGGFPEPEGKTPCFGDECQVLPPEPEDPTPGTLGSSSGNPPVRAGKRPCGKGKVRKKGRCVKKKHHPKRGKRR